LLATVSKFPQFTGFVQSALRFFESSRIGEIQDNGQFDVVWKTPGLVAGEAWSPILDDSKNLKADWTKPVNCGNFDTVANKCIGKAAK